jgi:hypothetical protein
VPVGAVVPVGAEVGLVVAVGVTVPVGVAVGAVGVPLAVGWVVGVEPASVSENPEAMLASVPLHAATVATTPVTHTSEESERRRA